MTGCDKNEVTFEARGFDREGMERLVSVLQSLGLDVQVDFSASGRTARVVARDLPTRFEAQTMRTRNAGRHSRGIRPPQGSIFNCDTPCTEFLEWQESHTVAEGMEQLGFSRSTYFRRVKQIREQVAEQERINRVRDKSPNWEGKPRLNARLGDIR